MKLIFLGPQGSGKSTQAKMVAENLGIPQIEMGQILRDKAQEKNEEGRQIHESLSKGELVPNQITIDVLKERIRKEDCKDGYLLDGYPRNQEQMEALEGTIDRVFYVKIPDVVAIDRLIKRARHDDTEEILKKRLEIYHEQTEPLLDHFKNMGILEEIDGRESIELVAKEIKRRVQHVE